MSKMNLEVGEIVLIPVEHAFVAAKILYISNRYKNVILLGIYNFTTCVKECPNNLPMDFGLMLYTSQDPIRKGRWISIGREVLVSGQKGVAKRIVGGEVWRDDQHLGPASETDRRTLPQMDVLGAGLVEKKAAELTASR
jgi:hypothetical protein